MKLKCWMIMTAILFLTGCTNIQGNLTHEEILERTMEEMSEVESYSFEIKSEQIDGFENEAVFDIQGETLVTPFRASIQRDRRFSCFIIAMKRENRPRASIEDGKKDGSIRSDIDYEASLITLINTFATFARKLAIQKSIFFIQLDLEPEKQLKLLHKIILEYLTERNK